MILAPLGAVSLLWNALFARLLLRPPLVLGTGLIACGAALIAVYGIVPESTRSLDELIGLFARPAFLAWFCVEAAVVILCLIAVYQVPSRVLSTSDNGGNRRMQPNIRLRRGSQLLRVRRCKSKASWFSHCRRSRWMG